MAQNEVRALVYHWFSLFDRNAPIAEFLPHLAVRGLRMRFPESTLKSREDFRRWYAGILSTIRTASHDVRALDVSIAGTHAVVRLVVRWQATTRTGQLMDFTASQRWLVDRGPDGQPVIRSYDVAPAAQRLGSSVRLRNVKREA